MTPELSYKVSRAAFEERYAGVDDPWEFATAPYEQHRYSTLLRALTRARYGTVFEPGCSVGVLTERLALVAERVIATDIAPSAVARTKARCARLPNVEVLCEDVAAYVPSIGLDLVVFSEIGYYFESAELARVGRGLAARLDVRGEFIAAHWLGHSNDHVQHGNDVHETLRCVLPLLWVKGEIHERFRIDCWVKA